MAEAARSMRLKNRDVSVQAIVGAYEWRGAPGRGAATKARDATLALWTFFELVPPPCLTGVFKLTSRLTTAKLD